MSDSWATPKWLFDYLNAEHGPFTLDAAASDENHLCEKYHTEQNSGLENPWSNRTWCNPPYSNIAPWVEKAEAELCLGRASLLLLPSRTGMGWFRECIEYGWVCFISGGRVKFVDPTGGKRMSPSEDHILVGFGIDLPEYIEIKKIAPAGIYKREEAIK